MNAIVKSNEQPGIANPASEYCVEQGGEVEIVDEAGGDDAVLRGDTRFRLLVDGIPVIQDVPVPTLGRTVGKLWVGVFAEGEPGRSVKIEIDDIEVVKRER